MSYLENEKEKSRHWCTGEDTKKGQEGGYAEAIYNPPSHKN